MANPILAMTPNTEPNLFAGGALDRLTEHRHDAAWVEASLADAQAQFLVGWDQLSPVLIQADRPAVAALARDAVEPWLAQAREVLLLGRMNGRLYFGLNFDAAPAADLPFAPTELRKVAALLEAGEAGLLAYFRALGHWHREHRYCGRCGGPTRSIAAGHERQCEHCGTRAFPRVDPAVIMLVECGERCLLGSQTPQQPRRYSTLAGFVEPGESLEDAVRREVFEETGIEVTAAHYHSSQPWPFPASLMLGFSAEGCEAPVMLRDGELQDARWFTRSEIAKGVRGGEFTLSSPQSIAYRLIRNWYERDGSSLADLTLG